MRLFTYLGLTGLTAFTGFTLFSSLFLACDEVPWGSCSCTDMGCPEGANVELLHKPDTTQYTNLKVSIAYADTVEASAEAWGMGGPDGHAFISRKLVNLRPTRIQVHLDYSHLRSENQQGTVHQQGIANRITLDTTLAWTSRVCNECWGDGRNCEDDMAHTAQLVWDLSQVNFE